MLPVPVKKQENCYTRHFANFNLIGIRVQIALKKNEKIK